MLHLTAQIVLPPDFILVYLWYRLCIWLQHAVAPPPVSFRNTGFSWTYGILHSCITLALLRFAVINWKKYDFLAWNRDFSHEIPKIFSRLPPQLETIWFFGVKSWFFTRNTPNIFAPPSARRNFFKCAPLTWNPGSAPVICGNLNTIHLPGHSEINNVIITTNVIPPQV
jgi:hypothetical protein